MVIIDLQWKSMMPINCLVSHILQNIIFFVQQKEEIPFGMFGGVNDDRIFIFGWTVSLNSSVFKMANNTDTANI